MKSLSGLPKDMITQRPDAACGDAVHRRGSVPVPRQAGQALAEFLAIAVALVPLFLLFPMIAKYQDLSHMTQMASRYAAFDATSFGNSEGFNDWKPPARLAGEVRRRFYSNHGAAIKTGDIAGNFDAHRNLFWRDPFGGNLIRDFDDVGVSFGVNAAQQDGGFISGTGAEGSLFSAPFANAATIGLASRGVYTANVAVTLQNLPAAFTNTKPFDAIDLTIRRQTSLLFDPWNSPTTQKTEQRVGRLAPVNTALAPVSPLLDVAIKLLDRDKVAPPEFGDLRKWRDIVPADRLVEIK